MGWRRAEGAYGELEGSGAELNDSTVSAWLGGKALVCSELREKKVESAGRTVPGGAPGTQDA